MPLPIAQLDDSVRHARDQLLALGARLDAFTRAVCPCTDPECIYHAPERFPLHLVLQEVAEAARDLRTPAAEEPRDQRDLRTALLALGEPLGIFRCGCDEPACPTATAPSAPLADLLYTAYVQWYGLSGCAGRDGADQALRAAEIAVRNLHAVQAWTRRLESVPRVFLEEAVRSYRERAPAPWPYEARALAAECLDRWIPHVATLLEVVEAMDLVLVIAEHAEFPDEDAALWMQLANDGLIALMIRDLADPAVCNAMYEGMEPLVPVRGVQVDVIAGRTGAAPGFFRFAA